MARLSKVPRHALGTMKYIPKRDSAWKIDLVLEDMDKLEAEDPEAVHPYRAYFQGDTRYDLDNSGVLRFLDMSKKPEVWHIRRLTLDEAIRVDACETALEKAAVAFAIGVINVENCPEIGDLFKGESKPSERKLLAEAWKISAELVPEVGAAVINGSRDLTYQEKKVSDSPPGD